jgi:hypothetical protein
MGCLKMPAYVRCRSSASAFWTLPTKAIQLLGSLSDFTQTVLQRVSLFMVGAQYGVDYALEKTSSCAVGVEDADRGYRDREGVVIVELSKEKKLARSNTYPRAILEWLTSSANLSCALLCCACARAFSSS